MLDLEAQLHYLYIKADAYCGMGHTTRRHFKEASQKFHECGGLFQVMPSPAPLLFKFTAIRGVLEERFRKHGSIVKVQAPHHSIAKGELNQITFFNLTVDSPHVPLQERTASRFAEPLF